MSKPLRFRALTLASVRFRTKTLVTRLRVFKEHRTGLDAGRFQIFRVLILHVAWSGGACRDRTDDPLLAKQVLSQLSYGP